MMRPCPDCGLDYDDGRCLTFCPHEPLMSDDDLARKDAAMALIGKTVRFLHQTETGPDLHVSSVGWNGMVSVREFVGEFGPHLFSVR